jgi:ATP-binding cassette, subfamily B, bacterial MsbA
MKIAYSKLLEIFGFLDRLQFPFRRTIMLIGFQIGMTLFEALSVTLLLPLLDAAQRHGDVNLAARENVVLKQIHSAIEWFGVTPNLTNLAVIIFVCVLIRQVFQASFHYFNSYTSNYFIRDLRNLLLEKVLRARTHYLLDVTTGDLVNDIVTEIERASSSLFSVVSFIGMAMLCGAYIATTIAISSWTVFLSIGLIGVFFMALRRILKLSLETGDTVAILNREISSFLFERIRLLRLIRLTGSRLFEQANFDGIVTRLHEQRLKISKLGAVIPLFIQPLVFAFVLGFLVIGSSILNLEFTVIIVLIGIIIRMLPIIQELAMRSQAFLGAYASAQRVHDRLLELDAVAESDDNTGRIMSLKDQIRFNNVSFGYPSDTGQSPAIKDVSFTIPVGSFTAIVGPSGAGKSTLVDLLARLHEPDQGDILVDGVPMSEISLSEVRSALAFVSQSPLVRNTSIGEQIAYGRDDASEDAIRHAAKLANADEFIMKLPEEYRTRLNEDGTRLSGGQRQRVEIARALFRKAPILILDEPESGLDADAVGSFRETLQRIIEETSSTVIVISHGLAAILRADHIIVLRDGRVEAVGSHEELMRDDGWYAQAFRKQTQGTMQNVGVDTA